MLERLPYRVVEMGIVAARVLARDRAGVVRAVFERSFYVEFGHEEHEEYVCIGLAKIGSGSLNVLLQPLAEKTRPWPRLNDIVEVLAGELLLQGRRWASPRDGAVIDSAPPVPLNWTPDTLARGLTAFDHIFSRMAPGDGLAVLACETPCARDLSLIARHALAASRHLAEVVSAHRAGEYAEFDRDQLRRLLGLGPGLTPSGDDVLAGALVALHGLRLCDLAEALWSSIVPELTARTHAISRAHLRAAAEGRCSPVLGAALQCLLTGDTAGLSAAVRAAAEIGHTSGWDILTGMLIVLRGLHCGRRGALAA